MNVNHSKSDGRFVAAGALNSTHVVMHKGSMHQVMKVEKGLHGATLTLRHSSGNLVHVPTQMANKFETVPGRKEVFLGADTVEGVITEEFYNNFHGKGGLFATRGTGHTGRFTSGSGKGFFSPPKTSRRGPKHALLGFRPHAKQSFDAAQVEEFYNKFHSTKDGKFISGGHAAGRVRPQYDPAFKTGARVSGGVVVANPKQHTQKHIKFPSQQPMIPRSPEEIRLENHYRAAHGLKPLRASAVVGTLGVVITEEFFNKYHDKAGRFTTGASGRGTSKRGVTVLDRWNHAQGSHVRQHGVPLGPGKQSKTVVPGVRSKASMKLAKDWYAGRVAQKKKSDGGVTAQQARQTVMNDLNKISKANQLRQRPKK